MLNSDVVLINLPGHSDILNIFAKKYGPVLSRCPQKEHDHYAHCYLHDFVSMKYPAQNFTESDVSIFPLIKRILLHAVYKLH